MCVVFGPKGKDGPGSLRICYVYAFGAHSMQNLMNIKDTFGYGLGSDIKMVVSTLANDKSRDGLDMERALGPAGKKNTACWLQARRKLKTLF